MKQTNIIHIKVIETYSKPTKKHDKIMRTQIEIRWHHAKHVLKMFSFQIIQISINATAPDKTEGTHFNAEFCQSDEGIDDQ